MSETQKALPEEYWGEWYNPKEESMTNLEDQGTNYHDLIEPAMKDCPTIPDLEPTQRTYFKMFAAWMEEQNRRIARNAKLEKHVWDRSDYIKLPTKEEREAAYNNAKCKLCLDTGQVFHGGVDGCYYTECECKKD